MLRHLLLACALFLVAIGCSPRLSAPETLPDKPPPYPDTAVLRPAIAFGGEHLYFGTGFVIAGATGSKYLLTAEGILGGPHGFEWSGARSVILDTMDAGGKEVATCAPHSLHIGRSYRHGDCAADLVIWPLADGEKVQPLKLATNDPMLNDVVWAIGEAGSSSGPKAYRFQVRGKIDGGLSLKAIDYPPRSCFDGAPLLNAKGEVVGIILSEDNWPTSVAGTVSGIRNRLSESGVSVP